MNDMEYNIEFSSVNNDVLRTGIAYIVIPSDVDRSEFISRCLKSCTVSIYSETNGYFKNVPVDIVSINFIKFPNDADSFGSPVAFVIDPVRKIPLVSSVYNSLDNVGDNVENQFKFKRKIGNSLVEIAGSPVNKELTLNVSTDKDGVINLNVKSSDNTGIINLNVDGDTNIKSIGNTNFTQYNSLRSKSVNFNDDTDFSSFEETKDNHSFKDKEFDITTNKFSINNGDENLVLGKKLKSLLDDLIKEIAGSTTATAIGAMPLNNATNILSYIERTKEVLSEIGFIDK